jgi:tetratricopeptide (TPR) repeat protein
MSDTTKPLSDTFKQAANLHKKGQLGQAEYLYRQILKKQPNHANANYNLGVLANQVGKTEAAILDCPQIQSANQGLLDQSAKSPYQCRKIRSSRRRLETR